jgi:hypothetical protein
VEGDGVTEFFSNGGIEIDHGDADLSACLRDGVIELGIGEDFTNRHRTDKSQGYARYLEFRLTIDEARDFRDWLSLQL